mmetsp:Transcript_60134/g.193591  ORF Transcript_60134/g.193591 Transcript_60134/m.193591 type:complete len:219 (-) Transcript_60134:710-1366(-)
MSPRRSLFSPGRRRGSAGPRCSRGCQVQRQPAPQTHPRSAQSWRRLWGRSRSSSGRRQSSARPRCSRSCRVQMRPATRTHPRSTQSRMRLRGRRPQWPQRPQQAPRRALEASRTGSRGFPTPMWRMLRPPLPLQLTLRPIAAGGLGTCGSAAPPRAASPCGRPQQGRWAAPTLLAMPVTAAIAVLTPAPRPPAATWGRVRVRERPTMRPRPRLRLKPI